MKNIILTTFRRKAFENRQTKFLLPSEPLNGSVQSLKGSSKTAAPLMLRSEKNMLAKLVSGFITQKKSELFTEMYLHLMGF